MIQYVKIDNKKKKGPIEPGCGITIAMERCQDLRLWMAERLLYMVKGLVIPRL